MSDSLGTTSGVLELLCLALHTVINGHAVQHDQQQFNGQ